MGYSPIKLDKISQYLMYYPKKEESKMIYDGIKYGFYINYKTKNLKSVLYQNTRTFSCSYFGDIKYFRSRFALAY
jgi:hypothetical protein